MPDGLLRQPNGGQTAEEKTADIRDKIPHITDRYIPLSHIITALSRATYAELRKLQVEVADLPDQRRRKKIVEFTSQFRAEFVKVLVLVDWAKRADEVSTAIDLRAWLQGQKNCFDNLLGLLRDDIFRNLEPAKVKAHDIEAALNVLSGNCKSFFDVKLSRERQILPANEIVKVLKRLDSLLEARLLLHEILPARLRDYHINSGRAIFTVENEFVVEVFFAVDNPESDELLWYMIDFSFHRCSSKVDTSQSLKDEIEGYANTLTLQAKTEGKPQLVALYNFLHRFTIQYQLERFFNEFSTIGTSERGKIDIKYASAQKVLAVGFWNQRDRDSKALLHSLTLTINQAPVSPMERFLSTARCTSDYSRDRIWCVVRKGAEEVDHFQAEESALGILESVKNKLALAKLSQLRDNLTRARLLTEQLTLDIQLGAESSLCISVDDFTGGLLARLRRVSDEEMLPKLQSHLDTDDPALQALAIDNFRTAYLRDHLEQTALKVSWDLPTFSTVSLPKEEFFKQLKAIPRNCVFLTRLQENWRDLISGLCWYVIIVLDVEAIKFWIAEMGTNEAEHRFELRGCWPVEYDGPITSQSILDEYFFVRLWKLATVRILGLQVERAFSSRKVECRYTAPSSQPWESLNLPSMQFRASSVTTGSMWSDPMVILDFTDICPDMAGGATLTFKSKKTVCDELDLSTLGDSTITYDKSSTEFGMNFVALVSSPASHAVDQFIDKWTSIGKVIDVLQNAGKVTPPLTMESVGLNYARFSYAETCLVQISHEMTLSTPSIVVSLGSKTTNVNPHHRFSEFLSPTAMRCQNYLNVFFELLLVTHPLAAALAQMEQENFDQPEFYITTRSMLDLRIYYPQKLVALLIRATPAPPADQLPAPYRGLGIDQSLIWHFTDGSQSVKSPIAYQQKITSCEHIFNSGLNDKLKTRRTFPEGSGIGCTAELSAQVLLEIHNTIMTSQHRPDMASTRVGPITRRASRSGRM